MNQTFVIQSPDSSSKGLAPIGSRKEIIDRLSNLNTAPEREGEDTLFGPGIRIDLTPGRDPIEQMKASLESLHSESVEGVLLASQPEGIRAFLTLDEHFPAVYVPLMFCPGEPPRDDGGFNEDAFGELHPAAWTRLEDHED